jgi:chorismate-pyruvate lyase
LPSARFFRVNPPARIRPELDTLVGLFYAAPDELGQFEEVPRTDAPPVYRALLHHEHHMTVTVENFHGCPVDVRVLEVDQSGDHYARKILLTRQSDGTVVQFGIMRLNFNYVSDEIRRDIESQKIPLGRVLIKHDVLRVIHLDALWRVLPGPDLCQLLDIGPEEATYGRTAVIDCNGEPAVELLEIVTPVRE